MRDSHTPETASLSEELPHLPPQDVPHTNWFKRLASSDVLRIAAIVLVFAWFPMHRERWGGVTDADLWWHLRAGEWITQNHHLPVTDPFSYTGAGKPWIAYSWSFEVLLYLSLIHI